MKKYENLIKAFSVLGLATLFLGLFIPCVFPLPNTEEFINIYCFTVRQIAEHRWYLQRGEEKYKKDFITELNEKRLIYCVDDLLAYYKNEKDIEYDVNQMNDSIEKLRNIIEEEFKLDNKKK